ncbi:hypothetical protein B9W62_14055 [Streptomyces sp. CS113]|uniref:hypothetical protein n=1 Tax=Streptomyces sp. CS113 TaxID=1982761 RepID=UPI000B419C7E|nr:hypothetical protein [Streptomyces sp. CS113]OWA08911.1 hypothetical protein B9W62_14055 [Streptomyces sp. CS113]
MLENDRQDPFEDRLGTALRDAGDGFETDRAALVTAGRVRGRRALLRRRAAVVSGVAGVALAGVGGVLVLPADGPAGPDRSRTASAASASTAPAAAAAFSGDDLLRELKGLLPGGTYGEESARGSDHRLGPAAHLVYDDGAGAGAIGMGFARVEPGSTQVRELMACPDHAMTPYDDCTSVRLPDGSLLKLYQGYEYPDLRVDTKLWTADLVTAEGQHVSVSEWNSPTQKGAPVSRDEPPLSTERLRALVTAGVWREVVDAIPKSPKRSRSAAPRTERPEVAGKSVGDTLAGLLPGKLDVVARGGQESEYAYVVVDDGRGRSLVQINVQYGMADAAGQLYSGGEILPDGTRLVTRQEPGEKAGSGVVMWTVDTLRPGTAGLRVVISAFNTGDQNKDATRDAPAVSMEQLREIALSGQWDALR